MEKYQPTICPYEFTITNIISAYYFYSRNPNWVWEPEPYDHHYLVMTLSGNCKRIVNQEKYDIKPYTIFYTPPGIRFKNTGQKSDFSYITIRFFAEAQDNRLPIPAVYYPKDYKPYLNKFSEAERIFSTQSSVYTVYVKKLLYDIIISIIEDSNNLNNEYHSYTIKKSVDYIEEHFMNNQISIDEIAAMSNISPAHFRKIFKNLFKVTPSQYINSLKILKAKSLLIETDMSINEIAYTTGFSSSAYFDQVFKKSEAISPIKYRNKFGLDFD